MNNLAPVKNSFFIGTTAKKNKGKIQGVDLVL
jgi:hypothetical protein